MYVIREVMFCKPGKVRDMVNKFKAVGAVMEGMGFAPFRIVTDLSAERFWTVQAEAEVESLNDFLAMEDQVMSNPDAQAAMAGYHELVDSGRREIYRLEA